MTVYPPVSTLCDRWIYAAPSSERFLSFQGSKRQKDVSVSLSPETPNYVSKSKLSLQCVFLDASLGCGCPHACVRGHEFTLLAVPSQRLTDSYCFTVSPASSQTSIESLIQDRNTAKPSVRTNPNSGLSSHLPTAPQPALPDEETQKECSFKIIARSTCTLVSLS